MSSFPEATSSSRIFSLAQQRLSSASFQRASTSPAACLPPITDAGVLAPDNRRRGRELLDNVPEVDELGHVDLCEGLAVERSIEQSPHLRRPVTKTHDGESGAFA